MGCLFAGAFRILRLHRLLGIELLLVFQVQAKGQGIPVEVGMGVVDKSAHAGDVRALIVGSDARHLDFHLLGKLLADGEALTVLQGTCLGERILGDDSFKIVSVYADKGIISKMLSHPLHISV